MSSHAQLRLAVIEIGRSDQEEPDFLIADHGTKASNVMLGKAAVYGQVADRLTAEIIVKSVNSFPVMLAALEKAQMALSDQATARRKGYLADAARTVNATIDYAKSRDPQP